MKIMVGMETGINKQSVAKTGTKRKNYFILHNLTYLRGIGETQM